MHLRVLYFAALRDLTGTHEEDLQLPPSITSLRELLTELCSRHVSLAGRLQSVRVARNEAFAELDERLVDGDVVALIPPVAGG